MTTENGKKPVKATTEGVSTFDRQILNGMTAQIAILDGEGNIVETNHAWKTFGKENAGLEPLVQQPVNYLDVCDRTTGKDAEYSHMAADGIRAVMSDRMEEFTMEYPCHSNTEKRWFYMRVTKATGKSTPCIIVSHENITPLKVVQEELRQRESELQMKSQSLEDTNIALKVLLQQRDADKQALEEKVVLNVKQLVLEYVEKLKGTRLDIQQKTYVEIIESNLNDIISPFLQRLSALHHHLTPQEVKVASLVRTGKTTKEIADLMNISTHAVDFHRKNIRKKFGLSNERRNLQSFLISLSD